MLHFDQSETNVCEAAAGLVHTSPALEVILKRGAPECEDALRLEQVVVLVSPSFYAQRKRFYEGSGTNAGRYRVLPLLFSWNSLDAVQLKKLMRLNENDNQLYVSKGDGSEMPRLLRIGRHP